MLSLHATTDLIRNFVKWSVIILSSVFLVFMLFKTGVFVRDVFFPKPPPAPTTPYGKLSAVVFPKSVVDNSLTYVLDTDSAELPMFPDRINVFPMKKNQSTLLNFDRAKAKVGEAKFTDTQGDVVPETALSESLYLWQDTTALRRRITMDIVSFNFELTSIFPQDVASGSAILRAEYLPKEEAENVVKSFLGDMSLYPVDIDDEKTFIEYLTLRDGALAVASSFSNAHAVRVNLFQKDVDKKKIVYPYPPYSTMDFYVASGERQPEIVHASYVHQEVNVNPENMNATYPIITADEAFQMLQDKQAYLASYYGTDKEVKIKNIYLAYYIGREPQDFLMPVIVFEGNDGFFAYISAIKTDWIK